MVGKLSVETGQDGTMHYRLECDHGITKARAAAPGGLSPADRLRVVQEVIAMHEDEEGCGCALRLESNAQA